MTELGVWLLVVGVCDLVRAARDVTSTVRRGAIAGIGALLLLLAVLLADTEGRSAAAVVLWLGWVSSFGLWLLGSAAALTAAPGTDADPEPGSEAAGPDGGTAAPEPSARSAARAVAFLGLGGGVVFSVLMGELATGTTMYAGLDLPPALRGVTGEELLVVAGVVAVQLATANVVVRLVLDAVGVPAATNEKQLKGGRLLGPMERLFIVGLGLAGQVTAAAIVVAAKGLLRFPELQWGSRLSGPSDVTEYFLIGSFASWLVALGGLGILALG